MAVGHVLELLQRTVQGLAIYSSDHPSVREAATALSREIASWAESGTPLRLGVGHETFIFEGEVLRSEGFAQLAEMLNKLDLAMVELHPGATSDELLAMACILCDAGRAAMRGEELSKQIEQATGGHVAVTPLTFTGLNVREGAGAGEGSGEGIEWGSLIDSVVSGGHTVSSESFDRAVADAGDTGARDIGLRLAQACQSNADPDHESGNTGRARVHAFVRSLSSETRQRIVDSCMALGGSGGPTSSGVDGGIVRDVAGNMAALFGTEEVMSSLDRLERAGVELSLEAMKLFQKLSRLHPEPNDREPGELPQDAELRDSVGELMGVREQGEFTPSDYAAQINACVSTPNEVAGRRWALEPDQVLLQKAEIALELLRDDKESEAGTDPIFRFLRDNIDRVIDAGRIDLLTRGIRTAQRRAYASGSVGGESESAQLLAAIDDVERVAGILEAAGRDAADGAELIQLVREADFLLAHVARILVESSSPNVMRAAAEVLLAMSEAELRPLIDALARIDLAALRAVLDVLAALPGSHLAALVEPLREDDDPRVRRLAYRALDTSGVAWCGRVLRRALRDRDRGVQRIALDHLRGHDDHCASETLTEYLRGQLAPPKVMWRATYRQAAQILADIEPGGEAATCDILAEGRRRLGRRNAARMREIAAVLEEREDSPAASRALRGWGTAPARLVAVLTGAHLPEGGDP